VKVAVTFNRECISHLKVGMYVMWMEKNLHVHGCPKFANPTKRLRFVP